jgi:hypothetical protein
VKFAAAPEQTATSEGCAVNAGPVPGVTTNETTVSIKPKSIYIYMNQNQFRVSKVRQCSWSCASNTFDFIEVSKRQTWS